MDYKVLLDSTVVYITLRMYALDLFIIIICGESYLHTVKAWSIHMYYDTSM